MDIEPNELTQFSDELMRRLGSGGGLDGIMSSEFFEDQDTMYMDQDEQSEDNEPDDVIILHMDIREPLRSLQTLVEKKVGMNLTGYQFCLQDTQELEPHKNLVDQCVKGEGLVQINVQIRTIPQRINIVDVLKPTEEALAAIAAENVKKSVEKFPNDDSNIAEEVVISQPVAHEMVENEKPCQNWVLDHKFKKEQTRLRIPEDPVEWTTYHVQHWFNWAVHEFELGDFIADDWAIDGVQLCSMTHQEFRKRMPKDPGNVFWTHLQLLKECKYVTVMHKSGKITPFKTEEDKTSIKREHADSLKEPKIMRKSNTATRSSPYILSEQGTSRIFVQTATCTFSPGNSGNMHLWQFLLDILTDREHTDIIQWVGKDGEFKLRNPEEVARLWGVRKNKPAMNYEKLSRALRYYYDGDMISKVSGKRFAYKFDCDLELLTGYSAEELARLVNEKPMNESLYSDDVRDDALNYLLTDDHD